MKKIKLWTTIASVMILCQAVYADNVAVIPFTPGNNVRTDLADMLTQAFIGQIPNVTSDNAADAADVDRALSEMAITNPNSIDKAKASEIGEKTSSQIIITGAVQTNSDKKNPYKLVIKCFQLSSGRMEIKTGYIPFSKKAETNPALAEDICRDVCDELIEQVIPTAAAQTGAAKPASHKSAEERQREREKEKARAVAAEKKAAAQAKKREKMEATYTELTEEEKILTRKEEKTKARLENKFHIDITDFEQMQKRYNTIIGRAITFDAIGGTLFVTGLCIMAGLLAKAYSIDAKYEKIEYEEFDEYYRSTYTRYKYVDSDGNEYDDRPEVSVGYWIGGAIAGPVGAVTGLLCVAFSAPCWLLAQRTANIYLKTTGYKLLSFFEHTYFNTHYNWDNKEVTVAMAIKL